MQPIPRKVKNVTVFPFVNWPAHGGIGPVIPPVIKGASGTYAIGTLATRVFYNLDLQNAPSDPQVTVHGQYWATGEFVEDGSTFTSPMMLCTEAGPNPEFARTIQMLQANEELAGPVDLTVPAYNKLTPLTNVTVSFILQYPVVANETLISGATGFIIATKVGTPHLMGVQVDGGMRTFNLSPGMKNITITGTLPDGSRYSTSDQTCITAANPAIFLRTFP